MSRFPTLPDSPEAEPLAPKLFSASSETVPAALHGEHETTDEADPGVPGYVGDVRGPATLGEPESQAPPTLQEPEPATFGQAEIPEAEIPEAKISEADIPEAEIKGSTSLTESCLPSPTGIAAGVLRYFRKPSCRTSKSQLKLPESKADRESAILTSGHDLALSQPVPPKQDVFSRRCRAETVADAPAFASRAPYGGSARLGLFQQRHGAI